MLLIITLCVTANLLAIREARRFHADVTRREIADRADRAAQLRRARIANSTPTTRPAGIVWN